MSRKSSTAFTTLSALTAALTPQSKVRVGKEWARAMETANGITIPLEGEQSTDEVPAATGKGAKAAVVIA